MEQCEQILSIYSGFSSSNRDVYFVLLETMLVGVSFNIDIYASSQENLANIYEYVKYNFVVCAIEGFTFQKENPGKFLVCLLYTSDAADE